MTLALAVAGLVVTQAYRPSTPVEIYVAPIVAPTNILGMGGAAQALATGSGAILMNPAAMAVRYDYNGGKWFDWDFSFDYLLSAGHVDIENSGRSPKDEGVDLLMASLGVNLGRLGIALGFDSQGIKTCLPNPNDPTVCDRLRVNTLLGALAVSYAFLNGEVTAGASLIIPSASFEQGDATTHPRYTGNAFAFGVVVRPHSHPIRLGLSSRLRIDSTRAGGGDNAQIGERYIPDGLEVPWQIAGGVAWSFWGKPLNYRNSFGDPNLENQEPDPNNRSYLTLAMDLVLIGTGNRASGRGAWLEQVEQTAGRAMSVSLRGGAESEFLPNRMRGRIGSYYEPSRFDATNGRIHGTLGFDLRLIEVIWMWRLSGVVDIARDYQNLGVSIGFWH